MQFEIGREALLKVVQQVSGVVDRRQVSPVLANILVEVQEQKLKLTGTDQEIELVAWTEVISGQDGATTVSAKKMQDIVRMLPDGATICFKTDAKGAVLSSGRSRFSLGTLPAEQFPSLDDLEESARLSLSAEALREQLDSVQFAMGVQDVRYYLNGALFEFSAGKLRIVSTDGHRLALADGCGFGEALEPTSIIVPRKAVTEIIRLLAEREGNVSLVLLHNHVGLQAEGIRMVAKTISGRYPDYHRVVPQRAEHLLIADRESLRRAVQRSAILANEKHRGIRFELSENAVVISSHNPEQEKAVDEVVVEYDGEAVELGLNATYMLDVLQTMSGERFVLSIAGTGSSCLIFDPEDERAQYVVMPMRL